MGVNEDLILTYRKGKIMSSELLLRKKDPREFLVDAGTTMTFENELGSSMVMEINGNGIITGSYTSAVGDLNSYPLTGYIFGNVITFTVSYTLEGSICAWAGQFIYSNGWQIPTLWHLVVPTQNQETWDDTYAGSDLFIQT